MTDPAVEAAQRALANMPVLAQSAKEQPLLNGLLADVGTAAAREALRPIREIHYATSSGYVCNGCQHKWPCATAKLAYPEEEL